MRSRIPCSVGVLMNIKTERLKRITLGTPGLALLLYISISGMLYNGSVFFPYFTLNWNTMAGDIIIECIIWGYILFCFYLIFISIRHKNKNTY